MNIIGEKLIKRHIKAKKIKVTYFLRNLNFNFLINWNFTIDERNN
jgi:hypothetical protein